MDQPVPRFMRFKGASSPLEERKVSSRPMQRWIGFKYVKIFLIIKSKTTN